MPVLTMLDTVAIQRFIFSSNRLKDIVNASRMAEQFMSRDEISRFVESQDRNIIFAAGGNALLRFSNLSEARNFTTRFSRKMIDTIPDIEFVVKHLEFREGTAAETIKQMQKEINLEKTRRMPSVPLLGLSVTEICSQTGLPASVHDDRDGCIHTSVAARRDDKLQRQTEERWRHLLPCRENNEPGLSYSDQLDNIGRTHGDTSLIGIIHVDGNGVGKKIEKWLNSCRNKPDEDVFMEYAAISGGLAELASSALRKTIERLALNIIGDKICSGHFLGFSLASKDSRDLILPLRPILCSGDDITLACDGRLALSVARILLEHFDRSSVKHLGNIKASAGVAIVGAHSPFSKAYNMAEELCASAKKFLRDEDLQDQSAMDWTLETFSSGEGALEARDRLYKTSRGETLTQRPYLLNGAGKWEHQSVAWLFDNVIHCFQTEWEAFRNKVKQIPEITRQGPEVVQQTLGKWKAVNPGLRFPGDIPETGFENQRTCLVDAVELNDIFLPIEGGQS
ncbi:MAG: hypothetical protein HQM09_21675 [Candidatus Riflebacteria bacterium]|nr:hypothetical protein [Candidatus Riflebacteria bacterium]